MNFSIILVLILFIGFLIFMWRKERKVQQMNVALREKTLTAITTARASVEVLKRLIIDAIGLVQEHFKEGIEAITFPIPLEDLKKLIDERLDEYLKESSTFADLQNRYQQALLKHLNRLAELVTNKILNGESRMAKQCKKRLLSSRRKELDIVIWFFEYKADPLAFFTLDVNNRLGDPENEYAITGFDLLQDLVRKKFPKDLRSEAEEIISDTKADLERWKNAHKKYTKVEEEKVNFEEFLKENRTWLDILFTKYSDKETDNGEKDSHEPDSSSTDN